MDVFDLAAKITLDSSSYESGLGKASNTLSSFGSKVASGFGTVAKVGATALAAASTAVVAFGASSVKTGAQFDSAMSQVAATMGTTVDSIQNLREFAMQMGATTAFSANQAAEALNYMALAGYSAETSMQMLPTVLNLAAAGGMELATASDMVTDAQSALGLSLDETSAMVDKMAKAASKSNTSVSQLGEAFLTVGGLAKNLSGGTTELSTVLGALADNGIKGAEGGTHLRNMILKLSAPTANGTKILKQLGVSVFDATGKMRNFADIFPELNEAMSTLTDEQRTQALSEIFNTTDIAAVNALLATSKERWEELSGAIDDSAGAAEAMANTQLDNLNGDITLFKSALEGAQIVISDKLTPSLREFVQFGTKGLSELSTAFQQDGLSGAMDVLGEVIAEGLTMITEMIPQFISAGGELLGALGEGILQNADTIIDAGISAVKQFIIGLGYGGADFVTGGAELIVKLLEGLTEALPQLAPIGIRAVERIGEALIEAAPDIATAALEFAGTLVSELFGAIDEELSNSDFSESWDTIKSNFETAGESISGAFSRISDALSPLTEGLQEYVESGGLAADAMGALEEASGLLADAIGTLSDGIATIVETGADFVTWCQESSEGFDNLKTSFSEAQETISGAFDGLLEAIEPIKTAFEEFVGSSETASTALDIVDTAFNNMATVIDFVSGFVAGKITMITNIINGFVTFVGVLQGVWDSVKTAATGAWETISTTVGTAIETLQTSISGAWETISSATSSTWESISTWTSTTWETVSTAVSSATETVQTAVSGAWETISTTTSTIWDGIREAIETAIETARDTVQKAIDKIKSYVDFEWELPKLKLPHVSISGKFSLNPPSVPSFSISWYRKAMENAMVLDGATIFGAAGGNLLGGGETGREVISGEAHLMDLIRQASGEYDAEIVSLLRRIAESMSGNGQSIELVTSDGDQFARWIYKPLARYAQSIGQPITSRAL